MAGRTSFYGGIVLNGLVFHIDAGKQESYAKTGIRYMQAGNSKPFLDFADTSKSPSGENASGTVLNGATFSNFAPHHLSDFTRPLWHNPGSPEWRDSAGIGTFYGNVEFDGVDDYVSFLSTPELTGLTDITVSAWFYINRFKAGNVNTGGTVSLIAGRYNNLTLSNGWEMYYDNRGIVYFGGRELTPYIMVTASMMVTASNAGLTANGGWYNAVGTKSGNNWRIYVAETNRYIDDRSVFKDTNVQSMMGSVNVGTGTTPFGNNRLEIGRDANGQFHMDGRLMSLSIYNRALSLAEINQNFDAMSKRIVKGQPQIPFISVWKTDNPGISNSTTIRLPINTSYVGYYNYSVDWGDGTKSIGLTAAADHTYAVAGTYTVKITGSYPAVSWGGGLPGNPITQPSFFTTNDRAKLLQITQWGSMKWQSFGGAFRACPYLSITATDLPDLSICTSLSSMFWNCTTMTNFGRIEDWNVGNVTNMQSMFFNALLFNSPIGSWDVRNVTNMSAILASANSFNQPIGSWNVGKVTNMQSMLDGNLFNQPIGSWDVSNVTNMNSMFGSAFDQPIGSWNVGNVTDMSYMFNGGVFNQDISQWNVSKVTNMTWMFFNALRFNQPIGSWNVGNVTNMNGMFGTEQSTAGMSFNQDISQWNVSKVTDFVDFMRNMGATTGIPANSGFSITNLDKIYNSSTGWPSRPFPPGASMSVLNLKNIDFGIIPYTGGTLSETGRNIWTAAGWVIQDGGAI